MFSGVSQVLGTAGWWGKAQKRVRMEGVCWCWVSVGRWRSAGDGVALSDVQSGGVMPDGWRVLGFLW